MCMFLLVSVLLVEPQPWTLPEVRKDHPVAELAPLLVLDRSEHSHPKRPGLGSVPREGICPASRSNSASISQNQGAGNLPTENSYDAKVHPGEESYSSTHRGPRANRYNASAFILSARPSHPHLQGKISSYNEQTHCTCSWHSGTHS